MKQIIIIGCSGHGRVIADIVQKQERFDLVGFVDDLPCKAEDACGYPVLGKVSDLPDLMNKSPIVGGIVAIGDNWTRAKVAEEVVRVCPDFQFISAIHPSAQIGFKVTIGKGSVVMAGAVINPGSSVGDFCIINTRASVDHDCEVGSFASLAPGATIGGTVRIGEYTAISLGANVIHGLEIGRNSVIGAGAVVIRDLPDNIVAVGVPARPLRVRAQDEKYL